MGNGVLQYSTVQSSSTVAKSYNPEFIHLRFSTADKRTSLRIVIRLR